MPVCEEMRWLYGLIANAADTLARHTDAQNPRDRNIAALQGSDSYGLLSNRVGTDSAGIPLGIF